MTETLSLRNKGRFALNVLALGLSLNLAILYYLHQL